MPKTKEPNVKVNVAVTSEPKETPKASDQKKTYDWRDPDATFAEDDTSLDAELWRMAQHQEGKR